MDKESKRMEQIIREKQEQIDNLKELIKIQLGESFLDGYLQLKSSLEKAKQKEKFANQELHDASSNYSSVQSILKQVRTYQEYSDIYTEEERKILRDRFRSELNNGK